MTLNHPFRLAVGSHQAGTGKGCAMNVISWENGDTTITDLPACADPMLAQVVHRVNDTICTHRDGDLLCANCSVKVLALAHRTVGTAAPDSLERRIVWVRLAAAEARSVAHLANDPRATAAIDAAEAWCNCPCKSHDAADAADAFTAFAADAFAAFAAFAAAAAAAADAAADAAAAAAFAFAAADADPLARAHALIDRFEELTGTRATPVTPDATAAAVERMLTVAS